MMDEIDFELCLNVDQVATAFHSEKRKRYPVHNNTTNSTNTTPRIRTHEELRDNTADESTIIPIPPAKRARISQSEVSYQTQSTNASHQSTGPLLDSSQFVNHYTGFFNLESLQQGHGVTSGVLPAVPCRAMSEEMDIDMMYMGSETETEAETEAPPERFHGQCPIHSFGTWSNPSFSGGLGSFSSQCSNSTSMFPIYEDPADMEIEGAFCGEDWCYSPDEDKENVENGHEQGRILEEMDSSNVAVYQRG
ncbi:hypothetical protein CNMCM5623_003062 [Aspergillus felis]|uniref:Uncharacterized protein n=1 Tax=Aspergillus felis TaxID=1287682 RepID=A0A8H6QP18_9EURO|nr:hypothetical protein CNMCM5623_003062 [Aspergillus felis]KAF7176726.1 hypothetical protein CNMCM7691_003739 [Aspergillus felis]